MAHGIGQVHIPDIDVFFGDAGVIQRFFCGMNKTGFDGVSAFRVVVNALKYANSRASLTAPGRPIRLAFSADVTTMAPPPSASTLHSRLCSGEETMPMKALFQWKGLPCRKNGIGVQGRPFAHGNHHRCHFFFGCSGIMHIAAGHHGDDAVVGGAKGIFPLQIDAGLGKKVDQVGQRYGGMNGYMRDQNKPGLAAFNQLFGKPQAVGGRGPAGVADADVLAPLSPQLFRYFSEAIFSLSTGAGPGERP
jgi:hypothetical protein